MYAASLWKKQSGYAPTAILNGNRRDSNVGRIPAENDNIVTGPSIIIRHADTVSEGPAVPGSHKQWRQILQASVFSDETLEVRVRSFYSAVVISLLFAWGLIQRAQSRLFYMVAIRIPCKSSYQDIQAPFSTVHNNILQAQYVEFNILICLNRISCLKVRQNGNICLVKGQAYWKEYLESQRKKRLYIGEQNQIKLRWERYVASIEAMKSTRKILDGNSRGKRQLGRHRGKWEDNIKRNFRKGKAS